MTSATASGLDYDQDYARKKKCPQCGEDMTLLKLVGESNHNATSAPAPDLRWQCPWSWCGYSEVAWSQAHLM